MSSQDNYLQVMMKLLPMAMYLNAGIARYMISGKTGLVFIYAEYHYDVSYQII